MLQYFQPLIDYLHQNPGVGILITFFVAMAESLPLIGTIIPGSVTMTAIGTLIGAGTLPGFSTLAWASLGAFIGDAIGFACGFLFTEKIRNIWPFKKYPHWFELSEQFFKKHGGKSIIFGRFVGPARSTVPLVAGLLKMSWWRFVIAAIPSAIMWAILYMVPGILIGALAVELPPHIATEFLIIGLVTVITLWLIFWAIQYFFTQLAYIINTLIDKLWDVLIRHKPSRPFIRLIAVKGRPSDHYQLMLVILCLLSTALFLTIFYSVTHDSWLTGMNRPLFNLMQSLRTKHLDEFFVIVTLLGQTTVMLTAGCLVSIGLTIVRQWRAAIHFFAIVILTASATEFFKIISHSARPNGFEVIPSGSSFPSGHVAMSFAVFSTLAYFSAKLIQHKLKWIPYTIASIFILFVALSRLYLGAHWMTDILGSITLGFAILFFVTVNYRRHAQKLFQKINKFSWLLIIIISLTLPWTASIYKDYRKALHNSKPVFPVIQMTLQQWWNNPTRYITLYRLNRFGEPIQPFNLEWAGDLSRIQTHLQNLGWKTVNAKYSVKGTLRRFVSKQEYHLPLFPWLYRHQPPHLIMMKNVMGGKRVIELRLWKSGAQLTTSHHPLWIGTINYHTPPSTQVGFSRFKDVTLQESAGIEQLLSDLKQLSIYEYKRIQIPHNQQPEKVRGLNWDGHIIIIQDK